MKIAHFTGCFPGLEYLFLVCGAAGKAAFDTMKTGENV
jgi:hypothetical protein